MRRPDSASDDPARRQENRRRRTLHWLALSYYFPGALFPMLLFLLSLLGLFARAGDQFRDTIIAGLARVVPGSASNLTASVLHQVTQSSGGVKLAAA